MKKQTLRLCTAAAASLLLLTSCASGEPVVTYKDTSITENEFIYYLATYKARFEQTFSDFGSTSDFYSTEVADTGMTAEEYFFDAALNNIKKTVVCESLAKENGLSVSDGVVQVIDDYLADFVTEYSGGSKNQFNQALSQYGINYNMLRGIYLRDELGSELYDYLYGSGGTIGITDADRTEYLNENYVRVRHIYVNNKMYYVTDENGYAVTNSDGTYRTAELTGEELDAKNAVVASIDEALERGEDFEAVYKQYSEDQFYENGYYITRSMDFVDEVVTSAFDLELGNYIKIESDIGTHYIMRLEMDESPWDEDANADFFTDYDSLLGQQLFTEYIESYVGEVTVNEEILSQYSIESSPSNYRF